MLDPGLVLQGGADQTSARCGPYAGRHSQTGARPERAARAGAPPRPRSSGADPPSAELAQHAGSTRAGHRRTASSPAGSSSGDDELRNLRAASSSRRPRGQAAYGRRACSWKWAGRCLTPALCSRVELTRLASDVGLTLAVTVKPELGQKEPRRRGLRRDLEVQGPIRPPQSLPSMPDPRAQDTVGLHRVRRVRLRAMMSCVIYAPPSGLSLHHTVGNEY
jgi:hypothetical protein